MNCESRIGLGDFQASRIDGGLAFGFIFKGRSPGERDVRILREPVLREGDNSACVVFPGLNWFDECSRGRCIRNLFRLECR